jgi:peptide/nickel transport system substrate-binding protein
MTSTAPSLGRRSVLALCGATLTGGCISEYQSLVAREETTQLSVRIKTVPADADAAATRIARRLAQHLARVGIDATVVPMSREELLRSVLLNQDFDLYVYRSPIPADPDQLRPLLHSRFAQAPGWQNPFGYGQLELDDLLDRQARQSGPARTRTLHDVQRRLVRDQPFTVLGVPDAIRTVRRGRVDWPDETLHTVAGYLTAAPLPDRDGGSLPRVPESASGTDTPDGARNASSPATLRMSIADARPTENLNPLSTPFRRDGVFVRLLYDSIARRVGGSLRPWLASSWSWDESGGLRAEVRLRDDCAWHDGERLTAADVAFTYRFLTDTSMGSTDEPVPSPAYRGRISVVDDVEVESDRHLVVRFGDVSRAVAANALTVPVLPEHVWQRYAKPATFAGLDVAPATEALVHSNRQPVGSGPLRVTGSTRRESLRMARNPDHFLADVDDHRSPLEGGFSFDRLEFTVVPSDGAAVDLAASGRIDATASPLSPEAIREIGDAFSLELRLDPSRWWYHVGYNLRRPPFTNPRFRRAVARLLDRDFLVDSVFGGYATPALTPLATTSHAAPDLAWDRGEPPLPFVGDNGELDADRARALFREAGYTYANDGSLVVQR